MTSSHELVLGGLPLAGPDNALTGEGFVIRVLSSGTKFGSPEAVVQTVAALAGDGAVARNEGFGNATSPLQIQVRGADYEALAAGERALRRVLPDGYGVPTDLLYRPPGGPASVRTVIRGVLGSPFEADKWDDQELRLGRTFPVTIEHLPFVRSEFPTVAPAAPVGGDVVTLWDGTSAAPWASIPAGQIVDNTGAGNGIQVASGVVMAWNGSFNTGGRRWVAVTGAIGARTMTATLNGTQYQIKPSYYSASVLIYNLPAAGIITRLAWTGWHYSDQRVNRIDVRTNPSFTGRQMTRRIDVGGTERTAGTIRVSARDGVTPTGLTLVHTCPDDGSSYGPDLDRWFDSGAPLVGDSTAPMGGYREMTTSQGITCLVPVGSLPTDTYELVLLCTVTAAATVTFAWNAGVIAGGTWQGYVSGRRTITLSTGITNFVSVGRVTLPTAMTRSGRVMVEFKTPVNPDGVRVRGMYAFRAGRDSALSVVDSPEPNVFITPESGAMPPAILVGATADGSDAYGPVGAPSVSVRNRVLMQSSHVFRPGPVSAFVVTANVANAATDLEHFRNWSYNAANDGTT